MAAIIKQFNTENNPQATWFWRNGDVSTAYGTETGYSAVWQWWLWREMILWSSSLNSIKPVCESDPNWVQATTDAFYPRQLSSGFVVRATGWERQELVEGGCGYPAALTRWNSTTYYVYNYRKQTAGPWDSIPEHPTYPGMYMLNYQTVSDADTRIGQTDVRPTSRTVGINRPPGMYGQRKPLVLYNLEPGREFFICSIPWLDGVRDDEYSIWGVSRIQNMAPKADLDDCVANGWVTVAPSVTSDTVKYFTPLSNLEDDRIGTGYQYGLNSNSGDNISAMSEAYFCHAETYLYQPNYSSDSLRWIEGYPFNNGLGVPLGDMGGLVLVRENATNGIDARLGRPLWDQIEYKGNIYLCLNKGLYWRIS